MTALDWAQEVLSDSCKVLHTNIFADTPYSKIHKIGTDKGDLFLKINNPVFNYEHKVAAYLDDKFPGRVLKVLFANDALNCFITPDAGGPLDDYFRTSRDEAVIESALLGYAHIQQNADTRYLKSLKIRELPQETLVQKFFDTLGKDRPYISKQKIAEISALRRKIEDINTGIQSLGIRNALEHGDFHFGNMLIGNGKVVYIDWAEATITNPLFSLCAFNNSLTRRLGLPAESGLAKNLTGKYLDSFAAFYGADRAAMEKAFMLSERIYSLYYIIALLGILAFDETKTKWQDRINASLDKILPDFAG